MPKIVALDHVQLAMPEGEEDKARSFFVSLLGFEEVPKPAEMARRGGCWFAAGSVQVHLGVEVDFRPARKAHPAFEVDDVKAFASVLEASDHPVKWDNELQGVRRFFTEDPFGNRIEILQILNSSTRR